jgi:hypothetical protein
VQACAFDIKAFHRTCPVLPAHKPFLAIAWEGEFFLDHCNPFGCGSASSNAGQIANAMVDIWKAETGDDADEEKYEDDLAVIRYLGLDGSYRFDRWSIEALIASLSIPWHPRKTGTEFNDTITFIGFFWDLLHHRVSFRRRNDSSISTASSG